MKAEENVKWGTLVALDPTKPSGLKWLVARLMGIGDAETVIGSQAGSLNATNGYYTIGHCGTRYHCHRVVWYMNNGPIPIGFVVDHKDGNPENNTLSNLRVLSTKDNARNRKMQADNTSGFTGVYLNNKTYKGTTIRYWMASWIDACGAQRTKCFRVDIYGEEAAKQKAVEYRGKKIKELIACGLDYTERHGTNG